MTHLMKGIMLLGTIHFPAITGTTFIEIEGVWVVVAQERNELKSKAEKCPTKKTLVYRKGVMVAFLKAHNEMKKQVNASKTD